MNKASKLTGHLQCPHSLTRKLSDKLMFLFIYIGVFFIPYNLNNDIYFILKGGRYVLEHGIPHIEPFTMHEGLHFVMQQWLTGVLFFKIHDLFGSEGLFALIFIVDIAMITLFYRLCLLISNGNKHISALVSAFIGCIISPAYICTRPQIFSSLLLLAEVFFLEKYFLTGKIKYLTALPLISVITINMHAAMWPMLAIFALPYIIDTFDFKKKSLYFLSGSRANINYIMIALLSVILCGFLNPYGSEAMTYAFKSYGDPAINYIVDEMSPIQFNDPDGKFIVASIVSLTFLFARHKVPIRYVLLFAGTSYMALSAIRSGFLFYLFSTFSLAFIFRGFKFSAKSSFSITPKVCALHTILLSSISYLLFYHLKKMHHDFFESLDNISYFNCFVLLIGFTVLLLALYREISNLFSKPGTRIIHTVYKSFLYTVFFILAVLLSLINNSHSYEMHGFESETKPVIDFLLAENSPKDIRLWTEFAVGTYAEYCDIPCYIDARAEIFLESNNLKEDIFKEYTGVEMGAITYRQIQSKYHFTHFMVNSDSLLYYYLMEDKDYKLIFEHGRYRLFRVKE